MNEVFMNDEASYRERLWSQLTELYVGIIFSRERHRQAEYFTTKKQSVISLIQITITALTSAGCLSVVITNSTAMALVSTVLAIALFGLNLYIRGAKLEELASRHKSTADDLLAISQEYVSLLTDFNNLKIQDIVARRDDLQQRVDHIYEMAPPLPEVATKRAKDILQIGNIELLNAQDYSRLLPLGLSAQLNGPLPKNAPGTKQTQAKDAPTTKNASPKRTQAKNATPKQMQAKDASPTKGTPADKAQGDKEQAAKREIPPEN